jgi:hypothetical protein
MPSHFHGLIIYSTRPIQSRHPFSCRITIKNYFAQYTQSPFFHKINYTCLALLSTLLLSSTCLTKKGRENFHLEGIWHLTLEAGKDLHFVLDASSNQSISGQIGYLILKKPFCTIFCFVGKIICHLDVTSHYARQ